MTKPFFRAHKDWEGVDEITIKQVPRFKTSHLSGDEWRVSAVVTLKRKGEIVCDRVFHRMSDAARFLPWVLEVECPDQTRHKGLFGHYPDECAQPGCDQPSINRYRIKEIFSAQGEGPIPNELTYHRAFCAKHSHRGDSSREDSDDNYELMTGSGGEA